MSAGALHGDGINDALFHHIWQKDELNFGPSINIPDTIIYKFGQPVQWYFTGVDGKVKRKHKQTIVNVKIEEAMTKRVIGSDIVASYISIEQNEGKEGQAPPTQIEYFDREGLHDFLYNRWKENSGILQRFVEPKGTKNAMIRAVWSPKVCLLERRVNNRQLHDKRFGLYERSITYEGPEFHSSAAPLRGNVLPSQIQRICENIVSHVGEVSFQKNRIKRMVMNFKVDAKDRIWCLYSSSIRLDDEAFSSSNNTGTIMQPLNIDNVVKLPPTIKLAHFASHGSKNETKEGNPAPTPFVSCISCGNKFPSDQYHPVPYKTVIAHFEQVITLLTVDLTYQTSNGTLEWPPDPAIVTAAGGVGFGGVKLNPETSNKDSICLEDVTIPPVIRQLHTKLTAPAYRRYRKDPLFLYKTAMCCENCFLVYAELASTDFQIAPPHKQRKKSQNASQEQSGDPRYYHDQSRGRTPNEKWLPMGVDNSTAHASTYKSHSYNKGGRGVNSDSMTSNEFVSNPPPNFPDAIRSINVNYDGMGSSAYGNTSGVLDQSQANLQHSVAPRMTEEIIQQREDAFFKEMLNNNQPSKSHPLTHLITAQNKLESLKNTGTGAYAPKDAGEDGSSIGGSLGGSIGGFGGKKKTKKKEAANPYERPQKFVESVKTGKKASTGNRGKKKLANKNMDMSENSVNGGVGGSASGLPLSTSAARHRQFLLGTLNDIQKQLAAPTALRALVDKQDIEMKKNSEFQGKQDLNMTNDDLPDDAKENKSTTGLFKTNCKIAEKMCSITSFASQAWEGGPHQITLLVLERSSNDKFRISITEEDLGFEEGTIASMPLVKLKQVAKKSIDNLSWAMGATADGEGLGLIYISTN